MPQGEKAYEQETVSEAFGTFDIHGNGYIELKEMKHLLTALGEGACVCVLH